MAGVSDARSFVGTAGFIPPEGPGTPQADLYSLGKVLYEISTGKDRQAFPELPAELIQRELDSANREIREIRESAEAVRHADERQRPSPDRTPEVRLFRVFRVLRVFKSGPQ